MKLFENIVGSGVLTTVSIYTHVNVEMSEKRFTTLLFT